MFLAKIVKRVEEATCKPLAIQPANAVAGQDANSTLVFLRALARAANKQDGGLPDNKRLVVQWRAFEHDLYERTTDWNVHQQRRLERERKDAEDAAAANLRSEEALTAFAEATLTRPATVGAFSSRKGRGAGPSGTIEQVHKLRKGKGERRRIFDPKEPDQEPLLRMYEAARDGADDALRRVFRGKHRAGVHPDFQMTANGCACLKRVADSLIAADGLIPRYGIHPIPDFKRSSEVHS